MKFKNLIPAVLLVMLSALGFTGCNDETSTIGTGLVPGEVVITIDTLKFNLDSKAIPISQFNSKTGNLLIGNIEVPEYGSLNCSFVSRLMCAPTLDIPDSLFSAERVDSCKLLMGVERDGISGDSLAPQKLSVYLLDRQLPADIDNNFDPTGYYNPATPLGSKSYTVSNISEKDSVFYKQEYIELNVDLPVEFGKEIFTKYKEEPTIFEWPQTFASHYIPGIYVKPTFGKGCVANIYQLYVAVFYHSLVETTVIEDNDTITKQVHRRETAVPFTVSPEVLSSNNINYQVSDKIKQINESGNGEVIITTPGGYLATINFPAKEIIEIYQEKNAHLSLVNDLILSIPGDSVATQIGINKVDNILLVKSSEYESFFANNKLPDNKIAFTGTYNSSTGSYVFTSMRDYIINLLNKTEIAEEDVNFTLVPVQITTETNNGYYGNTTTYVTKCQPYMLKPTMTKLNMGEAQIIFSFSSQTID